MNNMGEEIANFIMTEPPFKIIEGKKVGFRNYGLEAAEYKDIVIKEIK